MSLEYEAVRAPELRGSAWINTERPLTLSDLRGKLALLDFWTYCCINCLHALDDLKYLEDKYAGQPFVVVGVHSPKFTTEDDAESVRQAVARYGITHPVLLDSGRKTWDAYAVRGWPTFVLVDPRGYVLGRVSGEGHREELDAAIGEALAQLGASALLDDRPLPVRLETGAGALDPTSPLLYPGKVLADEASDALFVADTGHHRIIQARLDGSDAREIGDGAPGTEDGDAGTARFRSPQGMALDGEHGWLYIADTGNHLIRRLDRATGDVHTVAGTGAQGFVRQGRRPARETPLNSPWDLCLLRGKLYVAMAGLHQLWMYDPSDETIGAVAGSGAEGRADGAPAMAAFAQPSGITTDGESLYVADSEISCVRAVALDAAGLPTRIRTVAGGDLFQFGDRDGKGDIARFQHPLGVVWAPLASEGGALYVADTYNHKLRRVDVATRDVSGFAGTGMRGAEDGPAATARFHEPSGITYADGALYVADTNNHAIRRTSLATGATATLTFAGLCAPGICLPG